MSSRDSSAFSGNLTRGIGFARNEPRILMLFLRLTRRPMSRIGQLVGFPVFSLGRLRSREHSRFMAWRTPLTNASSRYTSQIFETTCDIQRGGLAD
jgi:hypothetical protein